MENTGIVYLIQPAELIGTNIYKIGCSKSTTLNRVKNGYKNGTRYISIYECKNPLKIEKQIKQVFNEKFNLISGYEYFSGDENKMLYEYFNIISFSKSNENLNLFQNNLEKYVRIKLGQDYNNLEYDYRGRPIHKRFDFDARYINNNNKEICEIFNNDNLAKHNFVIYSWKGTIYGYIIKKSDYKNYNYWTNNYSSYDYDNNFADNGMLNLPFLFYKEFCSGNGTVNIIKSLIVIGNNI
jgi:hypothetical protein